jgi:hypothetical protein
VQALAREHGVPAFELGRVGGAGEALEIGLDGEAVRLETDRLRSTYFGAIPSRMALAAVSEE